MAVKLSAEKRFLELEQPFRVAFGTLNGLDVVSVELTDGVFTGRGECCPMAIYGQSPAQTLTDILAMAPLIESGAVDRTELQRRMPANSARNAIDCALWDLESKRSGKSIWALAKLKPATLMPSDVSIGIGTPEEMAARARELADAPMIKLKLGGEADIACVRAVRAELPDTPLFVDVNCGWTLEQLNDNVSALSDLGVFMIEQPLPQGKDVLLDHYIGDIPLCADESCHDRSDLPRLAGRYQYINIKLDKTGGLTEALALAREAESLGFRLMVGCMLGSGVAIAPAYMVATLCEVVDLDVPLITKPSDENFVRHDGQNLHAFTPPLWG